MGGRLDQPDAAILGTAPAWGCRAERQGHHGILRDVDVAMRRNDHGRTRVAFTVLIQGIWNPVGAKVNVAWAFARRVHVVFFRIHAWPRPEQEVSTKRLSTL